MQRLDAEKKQRDAEIDAELRRNRRNPDVKIHRNELLKKKGTRSVRDPVTGKDVEIRDADIDFTEAVENPQVCILQNVESLKSALCSTNLSDRCLSPTGIWENLLQSLLHPNNLAKSIVTLKMSLRLPIRSKKDQLPMYRFAVKRRLSCFTRLHRSATSPCLRLLSCDQTSYAVESSWALYFSAGCLVVGSLA